MEWQSLSCKCHHVYEQLFLLAIMNLFLTILLYNHLIKTIPTLGLRSAYLAKQEWLKCFTINENIERHKNKVKFKTFSLFEVG